MPQLQSLTSGGGGESILARILSAAFGGAEPGDENKQGGTPDVAPALRALIPTRAPVRFAELEAEAGRRRVLLMRSGYAVPIETILALGGAIFLHMLLVGLWAVGLYLAMHAPMGTGAGGGESADEGGSPAGFITPQEMASLDLGAARSHLGDGGQVDKTVVATIALPPPPELPRLPDQLTSPQQVAQNDLTPTVPPLGISESALDMGAVKISPPRAATPSVAEKPSVNPATATVAGRGRNGVIPGDPFGSPDEPEFSLTKGGGGEGGSGGGQGNGTGRGFDRGISGANYPEPRVLDNPMPDKQPQPKHAVTLEVLVLASGKIGEIKVIDSSGDATVDEFYRYAVYNWKFSPAVIAGKPVSETTKITLGPFAE